MPVTSSGRESGAGKTLDARAEAHRFVDCCGLLDDVPPPIPERQGGLAARRYKRLLGGYAALRLDDFRATSGR